MQKIIVPTILLVLIGFILFAGCVQQQPLTETNGTAPEEGNEASPEEINGVTDSKDGQQEETAPEEEKLVEGKTLAERIEILEANLHTAGSGNEAKKYFPDFEEVYVDREHAGFPSEILPFTYYYSKEADITVNICNIGLTVFICPGKIDKLLPESDYSKCQVAEEYLHPENF